MAVSREGGSPMETNWIAERSLLRHLLTLHPTWSSAEVAKCLGRSESWVKPPSTAPEVVQRILDLRDQPPENLQRVPGPRALLYYLPRHSQGLPENVHLPRSTKTKWRDFAAA